MTSVAYPQAKTREIFKDAIEYIQENSESFSAQDNDTRMEDVADEDLLLVQKDLAKRKYGFQFKKVPEAHVQFMKHLEAEINKRGL